MKLGTSSNKLKLASPHDIISISPVIVAFLLVFSIVKVMPLSKVWAALSVQLPAPSAVALATVGLAAPAAIPIPLTVDTFCIVPSLSATGTVVLLLTPDVVVVVQILNMD